MQRPEALVLTYRQLLLLVRYRVDSITAAVQMMKSVYGDSAPMYVAEFTLTPEGDTLMKFLPQDIFMGKKM